MKIYKLHEISDLETTGEYTFDLSSDCGLSISYLRFRDSEEKKPLNTETGFKGIVHVIKGDLEITNGSSKFPISTGETFELDDESELVAKNQSSGESILLIATGPSTKKALDNIIDDITNTEGNNSLG